MAALTSGRNTPFKDSHGINIPLGVEANTTIYQGAVVAIDDDGYAVPATAKTGTAPYVGVPKVMGVMVHVEDAEFGEDAHNVAGYPMVPLPNNLGSAGALTVEVRKGVVLLDNDGTVVQATIGSPCFAVDDHTVSNSDSTQTRPCVGQVVALENGMVWVDMNVQSLPAEP
jgi:hypothetical protein